MRSELHFQKTILLAVMEQDWGPGEAGPRFLTRPLSGRLEPESLPGVAVGRNGSGYVLDIEWTELNDDWVGLRSERKTN